MPTLAQPRDNCYTYRHLASPMPCRRASNHGVAHLHRDHLSHHLPLLTLRGGEWAPFLAASDGMGQGEDLTPLKVVCLVPREEWWGMWWRRCDGPKGGQAMG